MEVKRGDIFYIENERYRPGYSSVIQDQGRPAIIVSNDTGNHFSNTVEVVYLTSQKKKPLPTHCDVVCKVLSTALCEQVQTVSKDSLGETDTVQLMTERDMYKKLYEQLLEKVIG